MVKQRVYRVLELAFLSLAIGACEATTTTWSSSSSTPPPPLITPFTADQSCMDRIIFDQKPNGSTQLWYGCGEGVVVSSCCPPSILANSYGYFSPGVCEGQYSPCEAGLMGSTSLLETTDLCCPTYVFIGLNLLVWR